MLQAIPLFIKPNSGGSSVGMSRINSEEELSNALNKAFKEDGEVIIEEFIEGREFTNGVMRVKGELLSFPVTEIITNNEFFDFEAKYKGLSVETTPAEISDEQTKECQAISRKLYELLNCQGVVRFDYILNEKGFYFLEVNTVPGLSEASIIPQQANVMGISTTELFTMMIEEAIR